METLIQLQYNETESLEHALAIYDGQCTAGCSRIATRMMEVFSNDEGHNASHLEGRCGYHTRFSYNDAIVRARLVNGHWELVQ